MTTTLLLCLTSGTYLTSSSLLSTISASTSCELPHQLVLPLAEPSLLLLLATAVLNLSLAQHTANNLQHAYVLTGSQKVRVHPIHHLMSGPSRRSTGAPAWPTLWAWSSP